MVKQWIKEIQWLLKWEPLLLEKWVIHKASSEMLDYLKDNKKAPQS